MSIGADILLPPKAVEIEIIATAIEMAVDRDPWEQQPEESDRQFYHFGIFRDLPPEQRTLIGAWRAHQKSVGRYHVNTAPGPWHSTMARQFRWLERVRAHDRFVDKQAQGALDNRRIRAKLLTADLGNMLLRKATKAAEVLLTTVEIPGKDAQGKPVRVLRSALSTNEIARLARVGKELQFAALGIESRAPSVGDINLNLQIHPASVMSDDELVAEAGRILMERGEVIDGEVVTRREGGTAKGTGLRPSLVDGE